ncbi:MAG: alpha/beta hydrolase [Myxococcales bacterium]|nr:alpha/beta hydrolase [Myxococcales bacterium]
MTKLLARVLSSLALVGASFFPAFAQTSAGQNDRQAVKNIVLVHGAFVDGSGWEPVYSILEKNGYNVSVVQNPTTSLKEDVAMTKRVLAEQDGPALLVGHSYGGAVISEAGNDPKVVGLVYIAAFVADAGESVQTLLKDPVPGAPVPPILPPQDGFMTLDKAKFRTAFAADLDPKRAQFMADSQVPWGVEAFGGTVSDASWKTKPSWYVVATEDRMVPPAAQQKMAKRAGAKVTEITASHAVYESRPAEVAAAIDRAARSARPNTDVRPGAT